MKVRLHAPAASLDQQRLALQAAMAVFDEAGISADAAESAYDECQESLAREPSVEPSPAMVRAAIVWCKAAVAAHVQCNGAAITCSSQRLAAASATETSRQPHPGSGLFRC
jgi:hypothetical protein